MQYLVCIYICMYVCIIMYVCMSVVLQSFVREVEVHRSLRGLGRVAEEASLGKELFFRRKRVRYEHSCVCVRMYVCMYVCMHGCMYIFFRLGLCMYEFFLLFTAALVCG